MLSIQCEAREIETFVRDGSLCLSFSLSKPPLPFFCLGDGWVGGGVLHGNEESSSSGCHFSGI